MDRASISIRMHYLCSCRSWRQIAIFVLPSRKILNVVLKDSMTCTVLAVMPNAFGCDIFIQFQTLDCNNHVLFSLEAAVARTRPGLRLDDRGAHPSGQVHQNSRRISAFSASAEPASDAFWYQS